jgi:PadR family transcriptional regulator PadR
MIISSVSLLFYIYSDYIIDFILWMVYIVGMDSKGIIIRGSVELLVLRILAEGECYGWQISQLIKEYSGGDLSIPVGTLYPSLYKLEERKYISAREQVVERRLRRYYSLLDAGREYYAMALKEYEGVNNAVQAVLYRKWEGGKT